MFVRLSPGGSRDRSVLLREVRLRLRKRIADILIRKALPCQRCGSPAPAVGVAELIIVFFSQQCKGEVGIRRTHPVHRRLRQLPADPPAAQLLHRPAAGIKAPDILPCQPRRIGLVIDEAQNLTPRQVKGIVTRVGKGTKVVLLGDPAQIDHPLLDTRSNGLTYASARMKGSPLCVQLTMLPNECQRSPLALDAAVRM